MQNLAAVNGHALEPEHDERRQHKRKPVLWKAHIETSAGAADCVILDLSLGGAKLRVAAKAAARDKVSLVIERFGALEAEVVWARPDRIGLRFTASPETVARTIGGALPLGR